MLRPFVTRSPNAQAVVEAISSDFINRANELLAEKAEIHVMLTGGTIGIATLALTGNSAWTSGSWNASAAATASIPTGVTLTLSGTNVKDFDNRTITNRGTIVRF